MAALDKRNREWATVLENSTVLMKRATEEASRKERVAEVLSEKLRVDTERLNEQVCQSMFSLCSVYIQSIFSLYSV
jgi:hypothetical protein